MSSIAFRALAEIKEFATFSAGTQRYIRRSLDVAGQKQDVAELWARNGDEANSIKQQCEIYSRLAEIRASIPDGPEIGAGEHMMSLLIPMSSYDLSEGKIDTFSGYRFLYERLIGVKVRPWLPAAFLGSAALPFMLPERRRVLLMSISEAVATASGWSTHRLEFYPSWVEKVSPLSA